VTEQLGLWKVRLTI